MADFERSPEVAAQLQAEATEALKILQELANPNQEANHPKERMPPAAINNAKGISVSSVTKFGLVGAFSSGKGFVITRLSDSPPYRWSAPLFFKTHSVGIGINLGFSEVSTLLTMSSREKALKFASDETHWGNDLAVENFNALTGTVQSTFGHAQHKMQMTDDGRDFAVAFNIASGGLIDLSVTGWKTKPDLAKIHAAYGPQVSPEQVLSGEVPDPHEFAEFYRALNALATRAIA